MKASLHTLLPARLRYLACIQFIREVKSGAPFGEHSPVLNNISDLKSWAAVNEGLKKMYCGEVGATLCTSARARRMNRGR
jgi:hypothetical protein